jgi:hypothetical protein
MLLGVVTLLAAAACFLAGLAVLVVVWRLVRRPPPAPAASVDDALVEALVHAMRTGAPVPGGHVERAVALARAGNLPALLAVAAEWEAAGGRPTDRAAFHDVRRALGTLT